MYISIGHRHFQGECGRALSNGTRNPIRIPFVSISVQLDKIGPHIVQGKHDSKTHLWTDKPGMLQ